MKKISELVPQVLSKKPEAVENESQLDGEAKRLVDALFEILGAQVKYFDMRDCDFVRREWVKTFVVNKVTKEEVRKAVDELRKGDPRDNMTPIEFISIIRSNKVNSHFLPKEKAYLLSYELMRGSPLNELSSDQLTVLSHALKESGWHFMKSNSEKETKPVFYRNYEISIRDMLAGKLKPIPKAIEDKKLDTTVIPRSGILPQYANVKTKEDAFAKLKRIL